MALKNSLQNFYLKNFQKKRKRATISRKINKIIGQKIENIDYYKEAFSENS
jgi:hypothetical protein